EIGGHLVQAILDADQSSEASINEQRLRIAELKTVLASRQDPRSRDLLSVADNLVRKSVWIVGGDGWAYDIGYGGLDHVLASGSNVNVLVLDTEVYSNTGGQASKATGLGAVAKFAAGGKSTPKKDLGLLAMGYEYVYVAQIAMGANENQTIKAFEEAESYDGPSLIIAYSHCIAHGIDMARGMDQQRLASASGHWPLFRYDPRRAEANENPFQLDSKPPSVPFKDYAYNENRYRILEQMDAATASRLLSRAQKDVDRKWKKYEEMARSGDTSDKSPKPSSPKGQSTPRAGNGVSAVKPAAKGKMPPGR
ncbi:MAG: thiamine pyrophosphate-dependent enzyme, partial [Rhodothermales bacterium]|nr:thiamine pyrophosphate-dependent enzyme [Rhodothermales bacterium]